MNKFILKSSYFVAPLLFLGFLNFVCYKHEGSLTRLGFLYSNPSPKRNIDQKYSLRKKYTLFSELDIDKQADYTVLTIGDSFSEQDSLGYKNYLANENNISVLHVDGILSRRKPIQTLVGLINGDFFDSIHVEYVVLQSVERHFVERCVNIDFKTSFQKDSLVNELNILTTKKQGIASAKQNSYLFSQATLLYPLVNMLYYYTPKPIFSKTYKAQSSSKTLFTGEPDNILFYRDDIDNLKFTNDTKKIEISNQVINEINDRLSIKNIRLILLICPDKYDLYYPYIENSYIFKEPVFFNHFNQLNKKYLFTSLEDAFYEHENIIKDVYYYDDTHWSPIGAKIVASELIKLMNIK
jgi:hypothetical protein